MADPRPLTRKELAEFLPSQRAIRAFEKLFDLVPGEFDDQTALIETISVAAAIADGKAGSALDAIEFLRGAVDIISNAPAGQAEEIEARLAELIESAQVAPAVSEDNHLVTDYVDLDRNPPAGNAPGRLRWNSVETCLDVGMTNKTTLQVGLETLVRVTNNTASQINDGKVVRFSGASGDIEVEEYIADGSSPAFYFIGVATDDIPAGERGFVTKFGKVRALDTSSWTVGTLLYASATTAGALTSTRPTSPNDVVFVAIVLVQDATEGEMFINPVVPAGLTYASYTSTVDQTLAAANTAYPITYNNTDVEYGISLVSSSRITVEQSGLYDVAVSLQVTSSNASTQTVYAWLSKNGTDMPRSRLDLTIKANGDTKVLSTTFKINLLASDYIEVKWAGDNTDLTLDAIAATAFAPSAPSAIVAIGQAQL